nr:phage tail assembly chaperone [bacterium]
MVEETDMDLMWAKMRRVRNALLLQSDKYVLPDLWEGYTVAQRGEVRRYRMELRDWPENIDTPFSLGTKLPAKPSFVKDVGTYSLRR